MDIIFSIGYHGYVLRIPDSYDAKIAKICYLWTLLPVIQLKDHIFEIRQTSDKKAFLSDFEKMVYKVNYRPERPEMAVFCYFCIITIRYP